MAHTKTRTRSLSSSDRSHSVNDDIVSLNSWSDNVDLMDYPIDAVESRRFRTASVGSRSNSSRSSYKKSERKAERIPQRADVRVEKCVPVRSEPSKCQSDTIPTVSSGIIYHEPLSSSWSEYDSNSLHFQDGHSKIARNIQSQHSSFQRFFSGTTRLNYVQEVEPCQSSSHTSEVMHIPYAGNHHCYNYTSKATRHHGSSSQHPRNPHHPHSYLKSRSGHQGFGSGPIYSNGGHNAPLEQVIEREGEKIKTKMKSMWNNVKYGWTIKTKANFKYDSPIFLLGLCYHRRADENTGQEQDEQVAHYPASLPHSKELHHSAPRPLSKLHHSAPQLQQQHQVSALDEFHSDFTSRLWFTYRREFAPIGSSKMTTDCGWGCMLRSGQMMMAQALVTHFLGRKWRVYSEQKVEDLAFYREIIRWFGDFPSDKMPFSIHRLVELGTSVGKMPGDWYGPASVAQIFSDALVKAAVSYPLLSNICIYVAQDCTIYLQDLYCLVSSHPRTDSQLSVDGVSCSSDSTSTTNPLQQVPRQRLDSSQEEPWRSVIILVPMRLGGESLNQIYVPCVKSMLAHDNCVGIIGGRPKHSLYFVGWQDDKLIYLDPHYCQDIVDTTQLTFPIQSFHCMSPRKMVFSKMDPSCTVGFYLRDRRELMNFIEQVQDLVVPPGQKGLYPLFVVSEGSVDSIHQEPPLKELGRLRIRHIHVDKDGNRVRSPTRESEDFVIL